MPQELHTSAPAPLEGGALARFFDDPPLDRVGLADRRRFLADPALPIATAAGDPESGDRAPTPADGLRLPFRALG